MLLANAIGYNLRFGSSIESQPAHDYAAYALAIVVGWLIALQNAGGYDIRHLATGPTEAKIVFRASAVTVSVLAVFCYATKTQVARGFVIGVIPVGIALLFLGRALVRQFVNYRRRNGHWVHRILAVGTTESVHHLLEVTERATGAGLHVVGVCVEDSPHGAVIGDGNGARVLGGVREAAATAARVDADVVAVTGSGLGPRGVRELGWDLEGTGRGLVIAPSLTEIAGPRVRVSPVEGLPLVWLEQPQLGRLPRITKRTVDILGGILLTLIALPFLIVVAIAIKIDSRGPVFYRQRRLGVHGSEFMLLKLRTMYTDADSRRDDYLEFNEQDGGGVLFKMHRDPRVTRVGKWLRQFSIDEMPQLLHVIRGKMSLVGPRPLAADRLHLHRLGPPPAADAAGPHRAVAGERAVRSQLGRRGAPGSLLRRELEPGRRHGHPGPDHSGRFAPNGRVLTAGRMARSSGRLTRPPVSGLSFVVIGAGYFVVTYSAFSESRTAHVRP